MENYKICFICAGNACRSPFAECVMRKLLADAEVENIEMFSMGTLDWGENPHDAAMVDVAKELGYELKGITKVMASEWLMTADVIIVFDERHRDAVTRVLDYIIGTILCCLIASHWIWKAMWKTHITRLLLYIAMWRNTSKTVVND